MISEPTWGVVATIRASADDILTFAAHYLDLGAHRVFIYLDEDVPSARAALKAHPKCRVTLTDEAYWSRRREARGRPGGHQHRQILNATHCYARAREVDWLLHADVDEFLLAEQSLPEQLASLPREARSARVRPIELLQSDPDDPPPDGQAWCKSFDISPKIRRAQTLKIYPGFGAHLNGGFMSHVAGKIFARTGLEDVTLRIHNNFIDGAKDPTLVELPGCRLVHRHACSWEDWWGRYRYRLTRGAYRPDLKGASGHSDTTLTMHELLTKIENEGGEKALRAFYDEVCVATPDLRERLAREGHLHAVTLDLERKRLDHFGKTP